MWRSLAKRTTQTRVRLDIGEPHQQIGEAWPVVHRDGLKSTGGDEVPRTIGDHDVADLDGAR
jgi:hypothetical protein